MRARFQLCVECRLGWMKVAKDQMGLAVLLLEGDGRHRAVFAAFFIRPHDLLARHDFEVAAVEGHRLVEGRMAHDEVVGAAGANIHFAGNEGDAEGCGRPPLHHQFGRGPGVEDDARGRIEGAGDDDFAIGMAIRGGDRLGGSVHSLVLRPSDCSFCLSCSTTLSSSLKRAAHIWR